MTIKDTAYIIEGGEISYSCMGNAQLGVSSYPLRCGRSEIFKVRFGSTASIRDRRLFPEPAQQCPHCAY